jgi:hypothetical protein
MDEIRETSEQLARALGEAVIRMWGRLPHDVQQSLFEQAATSQGQDIRAQLAILLHDKHPRTSASIQAHAMLEPDSLGG